MDLREEFDLADAAAPALEIIAGAERLPLRMVIAYPPGDVDDLADRPEIEAAPPHERPDRIEETRAERHIPAAGTRADEGGALPRQRLRFVISDRCLDRDRDRGDLGRRAQPQVDAQHIAVAVARLEQFHHAPPDPDRGVDRLLARLGRQGFGVEQQDRIDIRRIIELAAPLFAERDRGEADRRGARRALLDRGTDRAIERGIGEIGQHPRHRGEIERARKIADRRGQRQPPPRQPQRLAHRPLAERRRLAQRQRAGRQRRGEIGLAIDQHRQERRVVAGTVDRVFRDGGSYLSDVIHDQCYLPRNFIAVQPFSLGWNVELPRLTSYPRRVRSCRRRGTPTRSANRCVARSSRRPCRIRCAGCSIGSIVWNRPARIARY